MEQKIKIFGVPLDALPSPERVNLKLAYINYLRNETFNKREIKDPYDFIKHYITKSISLNNKIEWAGKISIPSWLTPKPKVRDLPKLSIDKLNKFLRNNGCLEYTLMIADYIDKEIYPNMPVMLGVDHSLTAGSIMALAKRHPNLNVIILDAHVDVMSADGIYLEDGQSGKTMFNSLNDGKTKFETILSYYECGNFLNYLLEKGIISPKNLWILGVQDGIYREIKQMGNSQQNLDLDALPIKKWMGEGVHVIFKDEVKSSKFKIDLNGPTYLSIDMDIGSLSSIYSARFMNSYGLNREEFLQLLNKVSRFIEASRCPLVGLDIMEFDVHFFEEAKESNVDDNTEEIIKEIFEIFINKNKSKFAS